MSVIRAYFGVAHPAVLAEASDISDRDRRLAPATEQRVPHLEPPAPGEVRCTAVISLLVMAEAESKSLLMAGLKDEIESTERSPA